MRFSIIVPFLNEERYIETCIQSLENQRFPRGQYEIIFVDNGSTDRSAELVRRHPGIILLSEAQPDPYLARNTGIRAARGEIIVFTDADCEADSGLLASFDRTFAYGTVRMAFGRLSFPPGGRLLRYYEEFYATRMRLAATVLPREICF